MIQLLQPLVLPLTHHGVVYGIFPLTTGSKPLVYYAGNFRELCRPSTCFHCLLCNSEVPSNSSCLEHACTNHPSEMENLTYEYLISLLIDADSTSSIFSLCKRVSYSKRFWTFKHSVILYNCMHFALCVTAIINPWRACAARVMYVHR